MSLIPTPDSAARPLLIGTAAVVLTAGMKLAASILNQFLLAMFLLLICLPIRRWLIERGLPRGLANAVIIVGVFVGTFGMVGFLSASISSLAGAIPRYQANLTAQTAALETWLAAWGINLAELLALEMFSPGDIFGVIFDVLTGTVPVVASLILMLVIFAFSVIDADTFPARLRRGLPPESLLLEQLSHFSESVGSFVRIKAILGAIAAAGNFVLLLVLGIDFPFLWTVVAFFTSFIPYLGYWLALVPPLLLALLQFGWQQALIVFIGYALINGIADNVLGPRMLGEGLNLSEVATLLLIIYWGWVLGPIGALLALPLSVAIKVLILDRYEDTRWLALALEGGDGSVRDVTQQDDGD
jgi:predicted PurR-regulated permease PerM